MWELYGKENIQRAMWPATDDGYYYDFELKNGFELSDSMFKEIEKKMREIVKKDLPLIKKDVTEAEAREMFSDEPYKLEWIDEYVEKGYDLTVYWTGDEYVDLCAGPHAESTKAIGAHKLLSLAGAYWRGDEKNTMLTRLYGTAFATREEQKEYMKMLEEAKKRDHRVLWKKLNLFAFSENVWAGLPMFAPKGEVIKYELENWMREEKQKLGYSFVEIPHIAKRALYEKSGHMGKYDAMMPVMQDQYGDEFVIKPMNCPHHFELFNSYPHSYRDMPLRFAENTHCYRNEKSGEVSGLTRVKALTQDDAHHFVRHDQIEGEIKMILWLMEKVYHVFGFNDFKVEISVRDPDNLDNYFWEDAVWEKAESTLIKLVKEWWVEYSVEEGEAAFYGPKIDIRVKDSIGRDWQLTTVQLDFIQPENFDMSYMGDDGQKHRPAVIHCAILGSSHRFMWVMIEHFWWTFPLWIAPYQVIVVPVSETHHEYARATQQQLRDVGMRCEIDDSSDSLNKKIRNAEKQRINYILVVGDSEVAGSEVAVRNYKTKEQTVIGRDAFEAMAREEIASKAL